MNKEHFFVKKVKDCIAVLQNYIVPDGITAEQAISDIIGLLDNAEIVKMLPPDQPPVLSLVRPICFIDLETTGTDVEASRIVEICVRKVNTDGTKEVKTMLINPGVPIPKEATDVHGISDDMVKNSPTFAAISKALLTYIQGCDIAGYHSNGFDVPMLVSNFERVGLKWDWKLINLIDVAHIFRRMEERTLSAAVEFYLGREHKEAHSAEADILETEQILLAQFQRYPDLPKGMKELALFSNYDNEILDLAGKFVKNKDGIVVFNFGVHKGKEAKKEMSYLQWMAGPKSDFTKDTKAYAVALQYT